MKVNNSLLDVEVLKNTRLPLIDLFIRRTAVLTSTPESLVEKIVKDQWQNANKQTRPNNPISEIDFSNLGTFYISKSKVKRRIEKLEKFNEKILTGSEEAPKLKTNNRLVVQRNLDAILSMKIKVKILPEPEQKPIPKLKLTETDEHKAYIRGS